MRCARRAARTLRGRSIFAIFRDVMASSILCLFSQLRDTTIGSPAKSFDASFLLIPLVDELQLQRAAVRVGSRARQRRESSDLLLQVVVHDEVGCRTPTVTVVDR